MLPLQNSILLGILKFLCFSLIYINFKMFHCVCIYYGLYLHTTEDHRQRIETKKKNLDADKKEKFNSISKEDDLFVQMIEFD